MFGYVWMFGLNQCPIAVAMGEPMCDCGANEQWTCVGCGGNGKINAYAFVNPPTTCCGGGATAGSWSLKSLIVVWIIVLTFWVFRLLDRPHGRDDKIALELGLFFVCHLRRRLGAIIVKQVLEHGGARALCYQPCCASGDGMEGQIAPKSSSATRFREGELCK